MSTKKNTGVVGCGWFGSAHCRVYKEISNLTAVSDIDAEKAKTLGEKYDINWYVDYKEMIKNEDLDAVSIVVPPKYIPKIAEDFVKHGIDVLMEKPLGTRVEDVEKLLTYDNVRIMPGFIELFNPAFERLKKGLPFIGKPIMASARRIGRFPRRFWNIGVIMDLAFHDMYILRNLFGSVKRMDSMVSYFTNDEFEDAAIIILEFNNGVKCLIEANWLTPSKERKLRVYGSEGIIEIDFLSQELRILKNEVAEFPGAGREETYKPFKVYEPLKRELEVFLYAKEIPVTLNEGIEVLKLALEASKRQRQL